MHTDAANLEARARERSQRRLRAGPRRLCLVAASGTQPDVQSSKTKRLQALLRVKRQMIGR